MNTAEPFPFRQFVLKVHSRCDLACTHCYIYEHADQSWRGRPLAIAQRTAEAAAARIAEHASAHKLGQVHVVLHGGEPLLLGHRRTAEAIDSLSKALAPSGAVLDLRIHTNGVLLDEEFCDLFASYGVKIGVSLDGDRAANDRHRLYRDGRSSHSKVVDALRLLRQERYRSLYAGLLCTVDIANDPVDVYRGLIEQEPPRIDLLLPHATWENQPPGLERRRDLARPRAGGLVGGAGEYARWLNLLFDAWLEGGKPVPVRLFDSVLAALHGRPSQTESLGLTPIDLMVIDTDGSIEQADSLKTAFDGAPATGFNVFDHDLDTAGTHPGFGRRQHGLTGLSQTCRSCPVAAVCGGGLYAHRYAEKSGFDNPSVYCADLTGLIEHIQLRSGTHGVSTAAVDEDADRSPHRFPDADISALAAGYGGADAVARLGGAQGSIRRDLLAMLAKRGPQGDRRFEASWDLLSTLDLTHRAAVDRVLAHPYFRTWAVACLAPGTRPSRTDGPASDFDYIASVAASAALHAGVAWDTEIAAFDGALHFPTLGALALPPGIDAAHVAISSNGRIEIDAEGWKRRVYPVGSPDQPLEWLQVRRLEAGSFVVSLEDTDPFRACHGEAAERLDDEQHKRWDEEFCDAVAFIDAHLPGYAPGLRAGLTAVMPMARAGDGTQRSAAARHAFGVVGAARPADPAVLALLLTHEFQHVKLGAVLDLFDLYDTSDNTARYYAPWRPDPRPLEGLLQGTYAHIAVTEFWQVRRGLLAGDAARAAEAHFARWREHTREAVEVLLGSGSLTPMGERFAQGMRTTVEPWLAEKVGPAALDAARRRSREHRAAFEEAVSRR